MKLYNNNIIPYINTNFPELQSIINISNYSTIIIEKLIRQIVDGIKKHKLSNISYEKLNFTLTNNVIPPDFNYYPVSIKKYIDKMDKIGSKINFNIKERDFCIYIIIDKKTKNITREIRKIVKLIYTWLYVISYYYDSNCSQSLDIYLYFTPLLKSIDNSSPLGRKNVNTAFTTSCTSNTVINIFRYEEWFKTFIHETFHSFGLDFSNHNNITMNTNISNIFPCIKEAKLFETYTEVWAEIINIIFVEIFYTKQYTTWDTIILKTPKMLKNINKMISEQYLFSLFQSSKILSHYKLTYTGMLTKKCINLYNEETPIFSYYILKTLILSNIDYFLSWCSSNNNFSINFNNYNKNDNARNKMKRFFDDIIQPLYKKDVLFIKNLFYIQDKSRLLNKKNLFFTTLRHSIHQL